MAKALNTPTQIISKGNELARELGCEPSPWQIHQTLGGKGNLSRIKDIWENRDAEVTQISPAHNIALPDE